MWFSTNVLKVIIFIADLAIAFDQSIMRMPRSIKNLCPSTAGIKLSRTRPGQI